MKERNPQNKKIILGITGSFGSGKSTVARILKALGVEIIDADKIAHKVINPKNKIYKKIIHSFGRDILKKNKNIDRNKLAKIVFKNKYLLSKLNNLIHPEIIRIIKEKINSSSKKFVVLDAPLLIEAGLRKMVDKLIVVSISKEKQIERIRHKLGLKRIDILKRINAQIPLPNKMAMADFVIDNNATKKDTKKQVIKIWEELKGGQMKAQLSERERS